MKKQLCALLFTLTSISCHSIYQSEVWNANEKITFNNLTSFIRQSEKTYCSDRALYDLCISEFKDSYNSEFKNSYNMPASNEDRYDKQFIEDVTQAFLEIHQDAMTYFIDHIDEFFVEEENITIAHGLSKNLTNCESFHTWVNKVDNCHYILLNFIFDTIRFLPDIFFIKMSAMGFQAIKAVSLDTDKDINKHLMLNKNFHYLIDPSNGFNKITPAEYRLFLKQSMLISDGIDQVFEVFFENQDNEHLNDFKQWAIKIEEYPAYKS